MIYLNENAKERIKTLNYDNLCVVTDFDRTITDGYSHTSWGILEKDNFVCEGYSKEADALYKYYYPLEIDLSIDLETKNKLMIEWWTKETALFSKYGLTEELVNNAASNIEQMNFRVGGKEFLETLNKNNIPLIIISAGIGNFIELFLKHNNCFFTNTYIISNFIKFEDGNAIGLDGDIIHSYNKDTVANNIIDKVIEKEDILLIGDNIEDIKMVSSEKINDTIKIGFLDVNIEENLAKYKEQFDIVCTDNTSFQELSKILKIDII